MALQDLNRDFTSTGRVRALMPLFLVLAIAGLLRFSYLSSLPLDRLDESYGRWLVDVLTIRNSWLYTAPVQTPDAAVEWLPLFQYISMAIMALTGDFRLEPLRLTNMILALATVALLYFTVWRVFKSRWQATVASLVLAFQPWHIDYSTTATDRILLSLLIIALSYAMLTGRSRLFTGLALMTMFTAYEGWFIVPLEIVVGFWLRKWNLRRILPAMILSCAIVVAWLLWNVERTGQPVSFALGYLQSIEYSPEFRPEALSFYIVLATAMTSGLFLIGLTAALLRKTNVPRNEVRAIAILIAGYVGFYSIAHSVGFEIGDLTGRLVPTLPLVGASMAFAFPTIRVRRRKKIAIATALLAMLLISYAAQISVGPRKAYVISPDKRLGEHLRAAYGGGNVICDIPTVIYYSGLDPSIFRSSSSIAWYSKNASSAALMQWLRLNDISLIVWQNATTSQISQILPVLGGSSDYSPNSYMIGQIRFHLLYEDSLAAGNWEHDPQFGIPPPPIFLFQVDVQS